MPEPSGWSPSCYMSTLETRISKVQRMSPVIVDLSFELIITASIAQVLQAAIDLDIVTVRGNWEENALAAYRQARGQPQEVSLEPSDTLHTGSKIMLVSYLLHQDRHLQAAWVYESSHYCQIVVTEIHWLAQIDCYKRFETACGNYQVYAPNLLSVQRLLSWGQFTVAIQ